MIRWVGVDDAEEFSGVVLEQQLPGAEMRQRRRQLQRRLHLLLVVFSVDGALSPRPLQSGSKSAQICINLHKFA